jgi:hypothetical protein
MSMCVLVLCVSACKGEAKVESNVEVKQETKVEVEAKVEVKPESADSAPDAPAAPAAQAAAKPLPARLKLFKSKEEAAEALVKGMLLDKKKLQRVMDAAPTMAEFKEMCPGVAIKDQQEPGEARAYIESNCPYKEIKELSYCAKEMLAPMKDGQPDPTGKNMVQEASYFEVLEVSPSCAGLTFTRYSTTQQGLSCTTPADEGVPEGALYVQLADIVLFEREGQWGVLFAKEPRAEDSGVVIEHLCGVHG